MVQSQDTLYVGDTDLHGAEMVRVRRRSHVLYRLVNYISITRQLGTPPTGSRLSCHCEIAQRYIGQLLPIVNERGGRPVN